MNILTSLFNTTKELFIKKLNYFYEEIKKEKIKFIILIIMWVFIIWMGWYNAFHRRGILTA